MLLIPVKDTEKLQEIGCFLKTSTLYVMHHEGKHPELFAKIGKKLFLKADAWLRFIKDTSNITEEEVEQMRLNLEKIKKQSREDEWDDELYR